MLLRDLTKVYISEYEKITEHGETSKKWKYKGKSLSVSEVNDMTVKKLNNTEIAKLSKDNINGIAWLNLQQDINELDRNSAGEIDYSIVNARTNQNYDIRKGDGISLTDISKLDSFIPDYIVTDCPKIGNTTLYKLEKYNGD